MHSLQPVPDTKETLIRIQHLELSGADDALWPLVEGLDPSARCLTLVFLHGIPLGTVQHSSHEAMDAERFRTAIWSALRDEIVKHLADDGVPAPTALDLLPANVPCHHADTETTVPIDVVIATHNRPETLSRCLDSLLALDYPDFRIVVVDNAPSSDTAADLIRQRYVTTEKVRYVREDVPGLAIAHNRGLREVTTPIVAFTDDDVVVHPNWLAAINSAFERDARVACVTGLIFPAELDTQAQVWAEEYWGFKKGFRRRLFDLGENRVDNPIYPYTAGMLGSGANMAFRTAFLRDMGGFDPALGAGTRAKGGDDLSAFFETVKRGGAIAYEPAAIVFHPHHREHDMLLRQAYGYGAGLTAYLTKVVFDRPWLLLDMALRLPSAVTYVLGPHSDKNRRRPTDLPRALTTAERAGMLRGGGLYVWSRWKTRRLRREVQGARP